MTVSMVTAGKGGHAGGHLKTGMIPERCVKEEVNDVKENSCGAAQASVTPGPRITLRTEDVLQTGIVPDPGRVVRAVVMTARAVAKARKVVRKEKGNMEMLPVPRDIAAELRQVHGGRATDGIRRNGTPMAGSTAGILAGIPIGITPGTGRSLDSLQVGELAKELTPWSRILKMQVKDDVNPEVAKDRQNQKCHQGQRNRSLRRSCPCRGSQPIRHLHLPRGMHARRRKRKQHHRGESLPEDRSVAVVTETAMNAGEIEVTTAIGEMKVKGAATLMEAEIEGRMRIGHAVGHLEKRKRRTLPRSPKLARRAAEMVVVDQVAAIVATPTATKRSPKSRRSEWRIRL
jgi:hypothetical protein